jgi:hypothetical protein
MPSMSFEDAYRGWRNRARRFSRQSIIEKVFASLGDADGTVEGLRNAPWNLLLILKWVCQDRMMASRTPISDAEFRQLRQDLWSFPERIGFRIEGASAFLLLRQIIAAQLRFQLPISPGFVRDAAILSRLDPNSILRRHFVSQTGIQPDEFIDFSYALFTAFGTDERRTVSAGYFSPIAQTYGHDSFNRFMNRISADSQGLLDFFMALPDRNRKVQSEYYEFPAVRALPIFRSGQDIHCWHPSVMFRGLEGFVHEVLSRDEGVFQRFTTEFEKYVVEQTRLIPGCSFYSEDQLKGFLPAGSKVPDALLSFPTANVFIESKAGVFDESLLTTGSPDILRTKTRQLSKAVEQARIAAEGIRTQNVAPQIVIGQPTDNLIVVTNRDVSVATARRLEVMYSGEPGLPVADSPTLPSERIYFMTAESFERLVRGCVEQNLGLPEILERCVEADADPPTSLFYFDQHLDRLQINRKPSLFIEQVQDRAFARLEAILTA